jgi:hypothetical protein
MPLKVVQFLAVVLTALAFAPAAAHLFALPNKIDLAQEPYFVTQNVYRGWALLGVLTFAAPAVNIALALMLRDDRAAFVLALAAFLCGLATIAIFFTWTYPANVATDNWTAVPDNWARLRAQWEYSHAASALLTFAALCCVTVAVLRAR